MTKNIKHNVIEEVVFNTENFVASVSKSKRKKFGQFFTSLSVARFMAGMFFIHVHKPEMKMVDAGGGKGILSIDLIVRVFGLGYVGKVHLTCY